MELTFTPNPREQQTEKEQQPRKTYYRRPADVRRLQEFDRQRRIATHPNVPPNYIKPVPMRDDTANGLTQCIIVFLKLSGWQAERISTTGRVVFQFRDHSGKQKNPHYIPTNGQRGSADVSATIEGRSVKIEVKIGSDRQSDKQKEYQRAVEQAGGLYFIARDFPSFVEWYALTFHRQPFPDDIRNLQIRRGRKPTTAAVEH